MSLYYANAGQAEVIRTIQKDLSITDELAQNYSDILRFCGNSTFIKYNSLCNVLAQLSYHGFTSLNNLQTFGEEYTGIIQVDHNYIKLPNKIVQITSIILEFGGEALLYKVLKKFRCEVENNQNLLPLSKENISKLIDYAIKSIPFIKVIHQSFFYLNGGKYHISKRLTGINYVLVRHWLKENQSIYGYKILGVLSFLQLSLALIVNIKEKILLSRLKTVTQTKFYKTQKLQTFSNEVSSKKCILCLEIMENATVTQCGHLYCWHCIFDWLDQKSECPICRESLKKSTTVFLKNYQ